MKQKLEQSLSALWQSKGATGATTIPRPPRRWKSRVLLPGAILTSAAALLGYSVRNLFIPATGVWVAAAVPVARPAHAGEPSLESNDTPVQPSAVLQAPGWIEPAPYAIHVTALAEGVVKELLVLEGDRVEVGQVVARLIDDDARMVLRTEQAALDVMQTELAKSEMEARAAELRIAETADQLDRERQLAASGAGVESQRVQLELRLKAIEQTAKVARADVEVAAARIRQQQAVCDRAAMQLSRMEVVSPSAGVVMNRFVEPGSRVSLTGMASELNGSSSEIVRLYDPARLQVRVDVAVADIAAVRVGAPAEIVTEALAGKTLAGVVTQITHEGNIQRNTIPLKVAIRDADPVLKPQMLVKVRIMNPPNGAPSSGEATKPASPGGIRLLIPEESAQDRTGDSATVWTVTYDRRTGGETAHRVEVAVATSGVEGFLETTSGLRAGDRVVVEPHGVLKEGATVRVLGERDNPDASKKEGTP